MRDLVEYVFQAVAVCACLGILYALFVREHVKRWFSTPEERKIQGLWQEVRDLEDALALTRSQNPRFKPPEEGGFVDIRATQDMAYNQKKLDRWEGKVKSAKQRLANAREKHKQARDFHEWDKAQK